MFPTLSVSENLKVSVLPVPRSERADALARVEALFPIVRERARQQAGTLSGGQRKLVALARAVVTQPGCCCSTSRPPGSRRMRVEVFEKLREIDSLGIGIVMVEQNARRALALSHRGYVLDMGRNAFEGTGGELLGDPNVVALYLGSARRIGAASARPLPETQPRKVIVRSVAIVSPPLYSQISKTAEPMSPLRSKSTGLNVPS